MSGNVMRNALKRSDATMNDPGNGGALICDRDLGMFRLSSAGAETRTMANPPRAGLHMEMNCFAYVGNIVITFASAFTENGDTTLTFTGKGQVASFISAEMDSGVYLWRLESQDGPTGATLQLGGAAYAGAVSITGALTPTGGVKPTAGTAGTAWAGGDYVPNIAATGATSSTSATAVATEQYLIEVFIPENCTLTGISFLVGATGGTDLAIVALHNSAGVAVANSALAGVTVGTAATRQLLPFTAPYAAVGPARYFINLAYNGTTARYAAIPVHCSTKLGGKTTGQTFGSAVASFTPPTTTNAAATSPVASTY